MYALSVEEKVRVLSALVEGNSIRSTERMTGIHRDTIMRLGVRVGQNCERLLDERMRGLRCRQVQADEIWTYVGKKEKAVRYEDDPELFGDQYVFVAMDSETKLIPCFRVGKRNAVNTWYFVKDLQARLACRVQLTHYNFCRVHSTLRMTPAMAAGVTERVWELEELVN